MKPILSIFIKEIKMLLRDPAGLILLFILPAMFIFILSISLQGTFSSPNKKDKLLILIVNEDKGETGDKIIKGLDKTGFFKPVTTINGKIYNINRAKEELKNGKYKIVIHIPSNTSDALNFKQKAEIQVYIDPVLPNDFASQITNTVQAFVHTSIIENIANISTSILSDIQKKRKTEITKQIKETKIKRNELKQELENVLGSAMDDESKEVFAKLARSNIIELDQKINELNNQLNDIKNIKTLKDTSNFEQMVTQNKGLMVKQTYYSGESGSETFPTSVQQNVPGWTIFALFWIVQIIAINMITERKSGVFKRLLISPMSSFQYILGKIIPFFIINIIQAIVMFSIGIFILPLFGCPQLIIKNIIGLILLTTCVSFTAISLGLLLATTCKTMVIAASLSALLIILMTVLGGIMVPKFVMPTFMQKISYFVPQGWALEGYLNIFVRDYSVIQILPNVFVLIGFALIFFILSLIFYKKIISVEK